MPRVSVRLENGQMIAAESEEWLLALIYALLPEARARVIERLRTQVVLRNGPRSYVLRADPGAYGLIKGGS